MDKSKDAIFVNIHVEHGGAAHVTHGPPGSGRDDRAPRAAHRSARARYLWKVAYGGRLYSVSASDGAMEILLDGEMVWRGERGPNRMYRARWSKLEPAVETKVLDLARSGDPHPHDDQLAARSSDGPPAHARDAGRGAPDADPPVAEPAVRRKIARRAGGMDAAAAEGSVDVVARSRGAPGSPSPAKTSPAKNAAAEKVAPKIRAPKPERPGARQAKRAVDDEKVMAELLRGLERDAPETAATAYATLRRAWFNGAREAVLARVKENPTTRSIATAYAEWAGANAAQVHTMAGEQGAGA